MNHLFFHPVKQTDLNNILEIEKLSFPSPWNLSMFLEEISNPLSRSFAAKKRESAPIILGYIFYQVVAFEMHILNLAVHPGFREKGIGSILLLKSMEKEKNSNSVRYVFLEVRENNKPAIGLYKKFGFKRLGIRKNYYRKERENALILGRPLL